MADYRFDRAKRLLTQAEFSRVFNQPAHKVSTRHLLILAQTNQHHQARLGLVVGKKNVRLASQRNRIKRLVRESFRHDQQQLPGLDIVVLARPGIAQLGNPELSTLLQQSWQQLKRRAETKPLPNSQP